ncbi:MAG TPA: ATP-binding protein [Tepidisphaeraceae bacterium]
MSRRNGTSPPVRRARSGDLALRGILIEELAAERVRELRATVTRLKTAQRELAEGRARMEDRVHYRDLFRFAPDAYLVTDSHAKILEANLAAARLLNIPEPFLAGKPLTLYVDPEQRSEVTARLAAIPDGRTVEWSMDLIPRGADRRAVHVTISAARSGAPDHGRLRWLLRDVTDQSRRERDLRADRDGLSTLATQLTLAQERERRQIATEIHDHIGQSLAFCQLRLGMLRESLGADEQSVVDEVRSLLAQVIQQTRSLTFELSPTVLYELGLGPAIEWLLDQRGHLGVAFRFETQGREHRLGHNSEITLFEAVREILSNVIKHSRAAAATVRLTYTDREVVVEVEDDGIGFRPGDAAARQMERPSLGLLSVRERMEFLNGVAEIHSSAGRGTRVRLIVPLEKPRGRARHAKESETRNEPVKRPDRR